MVMLEQFKDQFRVLRDEGGEHYIPLRGHCPGDRCRQFAYEHGPASFGVWLTTKQPNKSFNALVRLLAAEGIDGARLMQVGDEECVILIPFADYAQAKGILKVLKARQRRRL